MDEERGTALVTGAATRVGRALALGAAALGFDVAVHYHRSAGAADDTVSEIRASGRRSAGFAADLADATMSAALVEGVAAALGPVRLLVNNAAIFEFDRPESVSDASWARHMAINLHAPFLLTQAMLRGLPAAVDGHVVNLTDQRVLNPTPNYTSYTVSKVALAGLTRHLALALAPRVRVNAIAPGIVLPAEGMAGEDLARLAQAAPLRRATSADEIAGALRWLVETPSVTGQTLTLDSGLHLGWLHPGQQPGAG
ncbi:MAG TPA: SDR family oxidoreductase [Geminicoccaceae bacterium]